MIAVAIARRLPEPMRTRVLFRLGTSIVPMMRHVHPRLVVLNEEQATIRVGLSRRTRNQFGSMFFGAIATGADCVAGLFAVKFMIETGHRVVPLVKSARSEYLKKVAGDAHFTCSQGRELYALCQRALASGERHEIDIDVVVTTPVQSGDEPVARVAQRMSLRVLR